MAWGEMALPAKGGSGKRMPRSGTASSLGPWRITGTANDWLEGKPEADKADKLYVWKLARNCGNDTHCTTVTSDCARVNLDLELNLWIGWRAYLEPSTKVGPAYTEIVYDQAIVFRGE